MIDQFIVIFSTVPSQDVGVKIADELVKNRFASCVNIIPSITSIYRWNGDVCRENELLLVIKTKKMLFDIINAKIKDLHPYEVPEIISFDISDGNKPYLAWISENANPVY